MEAAIGTENTDRMHELIGPRFAGCSSGEAWGPGMTGRGAATMGGWGATSNSSAWNWMHNGAWRHMNSGDWRELAGSMMGARYSTHHGWSTTAALVVALGALLVDLLVVAVGVAVEATGSLLVTIAGCRRGPRPHLM